MQRPLRPADPTKQVSVVSFNVLLKGFDKKLYYQEVSPQLRAWPWRREQLLNILGGIGADIFCVQEVECASFSEESAFLEKLGLAWVEPKDDAKGKYPDMAKPALFYRADRFEKLWTDHRSRVVLAALRHLPSGHVFYCATCHLEGAPWEGDKRVQQMKKALESVQRQMAKDQKTGIKNQSVVIAGDFNEGITGPICELLRAGCLIREDGSTITHPFEFGGVYGEHSPPPSFCAPPQIPDGSLRSDPEAWNRPGDDPFGCIDFIYYTRNSLEPVAVRQPFTAEQVKATHGVGIPSEWHPSDHVPIGAIFSLEPGTACSSGEAVDRV
jgi:mRNA deadenylase 3'-5' endonuclease subunit Ccr4